MKIKILKITTFLPDITGTSKKSGFPYTIKHWMCDVEVNGENKASIEVKYMGKNFELELKEYEADENIYNGITSYQIQKQTTGGGSKYSRPTYTQKEYDALWSHALKKMANYIEKTPELVSTYVISAVNSGVKVEEKKQENNQAQDLQQPQYQQSGKQFLDKHRDDQETKENMKDIFNDDDIEL